MCQECSKRFAKSDHMNKHIQTHFEASHGRFKGRDKAAHRWEVDGHGEGTTQCASSRVTAVGGGRIAYLGGYGWNLPGNC